MTNESIEERQENERRFAFIRRSFSEWLKGGNVDVKRLHNYTIILNKTYGKEAVRDIMKDILPARQKPMWNALAEETGSAKIGTEIDTIFLNHLRLNN